MHNFLPYRGAFRSGYGAYTYHNLAYYEFVIGVIFYNAEYRLSETLYKTSKEFAIHLYNSVDDFVFCGHLGSSYLFAIMVDGKVGVMDHKFNQLISPEYKELIVPNKSDGLFVLKNTYNEWGAINVFSGEEIITFGQYCKLWGYEYNHALACFDYESIDTNHNRVIINHKGREIANSRKYYKIFPFYNTGSDFIVVQTRMIDPGLIINRHLNLIDKKCPTRNFFPAEELVERPWSYSTDENGIIPCDILDAYEGDASNMWNTD